MASTDNLPSTTTSWPTERLTLDPFTNDDFDRLIQWIGSEEQLVAFAGPTFRFPLTRKQLQEYVQQENKRFYRVVDKASGSIIGHAEISQPQPTYCFLCRLLIGPVQFRNKGYGQELVKKLVSISFNDPMVESVQLNVYDWNQGAIQCYLKCGFQVNPDIKRKQYVNGNTWTALNMKLTRSDWEINRK